MIYYLAKQNIFDVGMEVFGKDLEEMSFRYNKTYKYWYRVTDGNIIQFLGLARYQGGTYDLSFICQPLYVPLLKGFIYEKRGKAPSEDMSLGSDVIDRMQELGIVSSRNIPKIGGGFEIRRQISGGI